jgi:hypothetical protein
MGIIMPNLNRLLRKAIDRLNGELRALYYLRQIERRGHGVTKIDLDELVRQMPEDGPQRTAYWRAIRLWCERHNITTDLHPEDELSDTGKSLLVRFHIVERRMAWERPKIEAQETYVTPDGFMAWRQYPWTPSGILPVPADPEAAWLDFIEWVKGPPMNRTGDPPLRRETYLKIFTEEKPYHAWELRQPHQPPTA